MRALFIRSAGVITALIAISACSGEKGSITPLEPVAEPGILTVRLTTPNADDGALLLNLTGPGPITEVSVPNGSPYLVHTRTSGTTIRVAVFGAVGAGDLVRFSVPDVNKVSSYQAGLIEAADRGNLLRTSTSGYSLTISR